jgi:hypothetical protein
MAEIGSLSGGQRRLIPALLTCRTVTAAAESAKVSERTAFRWLADDANFQAELARAEGEIISGAVRSLLGLAESAVDCLRDTLDDKELPAGVRLRAAALAIDALLRLRELASVEKRLSELERTVQER